MTPELLASYTIDGSADVLHALRRLNTFGCDRAQTLFVVGSDGRIVGTVTDGDIRRRLVDGLDLHSPLSSVAHTDFRYLHQDNICVAEIRRLRSADIELIPVLDADRHIVDAVNLKVQKSFLPVDAVIMAGGEGRRLLPLTASTPKPLLPLGGKAIIDHIVDSLLDYGIESINVTVNYLRQQLIAHFADPVRGVQVKCVEEPHFLGTIGSLRCVSDLRHDTVLLTNSDALTNLNYENFYLHFLEHDADMSVAAVPYSVSVPYGILDLDGRNIRGVLEKPTYNYYANAGIYLIRRSLIDRIPKDSFFNATDFMERLIADGRRVIRFPLTGYWLDIGAPDEYARAKEYIRHINK